MKKLYNFRLLQDSLVEQSTQGNFVPHGRQDIQHEAIGQPEHPDRAQAIGKGLEFNNFSEPSKEMMNQLWREITEDLSQKMQHNFDQQSEQMP